MEIELSEDQQSCYKQVRDWITAFKHPERSIQRQDLLTMGGYAGTGKTTLIGKLRNDLEHHKIAFCAFTGKAASVLRSKLKIFNGEIKKSDYTGTIHSLIYEPVIDNKTGEISNWVKVPSINYDLIIIDEASMVSEEIFSDISSYGIPILAVGDHGQLPPIEAGLNLMACPDLKLEKIHRQAADNPIIKLSIIAREEGHISHGNYGNGIMKISPNDPRVTSYIKSCGDFSESAILCGFNGTRIDLNKKIRKWNGHKSIYPVVGERVICLKNNKKASACPIYNGVCGIVKSMNPMITFIESRIVIDGEELTYKGKIDPSTFNNEKPDFSSYIEEEQQDEREYDVDRFIKNSYNYKQRKQSKKKYLDHFDFGYVLTVHKSQGSEWKRVMVIEQPCKYWSGPLWNRWLYTAITRAKEELVIVSH